MPIRAADYHARSVKIVVHDRLFPNVLVGATIGIVVGLISGLFYFLVFLAVAYHYQCGYEVVAYQVAMLVVAIAAAIFGVFLATKGRRAIGLGIIVAAAILSIPVVAWSVTVFGNVRCYFGR